MSYFCYYSLPAILMLVLIRKYLEYKWGKCKNNVNLSGKVVVVTGANSGIGFETAKELAKRGAKVILACRDEQKAFNCMEKINAGLGNNLQLIPKHLDLASLKSIKAFVEDLNKSVPKIDILINNAGVFYPKSEYKTTEDDFEIHFGVNHLGHFLLTKLLLPNLKAAPSSRVIVVSSTLHQRGNIYLDDLNDFNKTEKTHAYNNSKLANVYFAKELARRVKEFNIHTYSVCPGFVYTGLFRNDKRKWYHYILFAPIAFLIMRTPRQGAQTLIYCATDPDLENESGLMYRNCKIYNSSMEFDLIVQRKLWEASENMIESKLKLL